ncbi:MetQ/NlpA family ABC transporter substrate-binding protein [Carnobacterium gallinarum]|uniref:MetQ/NlpA family ABC transporter substrate-binding protein n=1 Tax=Carnobacterium gallinarum TaxID=2749 RepID=UPI000555A1D6|nr:MetQ/NlpA family ABC transporter substrate-binding protein [Carnobacterium gallinarum]
MKNVKKIILALVLILSVGFIAACGSGSNTAADTKKPTVVKLGVVGENTEVWDSVKERLKKENIELNIVKFTDYNQPNSALSSGEIDLNSFQHQIFLDAYNKDSGTDLVSIGETVIAPLGIYSEKIKDVKELKDKDIVAIPNDVTNGGRALLLLQTAGLIKVNPAAKQTPTVKDITENKLNLEIKELDAAQTARALKDTTISLINSGMAVDAGFVPTKDAIFLEPIDETSKPYINIIVANNKDKDNETYKKVVKAYQSPETIKVIEETSKGSSVPVWTDKK